VEFKTFVAVVVILAGLTQVLMGVHVYVNFPKQEIQIKSGSSKALLCSQKVTWFQNFQGDLWLSFYDEDGTLISETLVPIEKE
jgi:uncharacterized membrane protein YqiK